MANKLQNCDWNLVAWNVGDLVSIPGLGRFPVPATYSSILAWRIPLTEEAVRWQFMGSQRVRHNWATFTFKSLAQNLNSSVQFSRSVVSNSLWPHDAAHQASLSITNSQSLLKLMSIESVMPSNHLIFCRPLLLLPSIFPSIRVFSNESVLHIRWPKYWSQHQSFQWTFRTHFL